MAKKKIVIKPARGSVALLVALLMGRCLTGAPAFAQGINACTDPTRCLPGGSGSVPQILTESAPKTWTFSDGCNTTTCNEWGGCLSTLLGCSSKDIITGNLLPSEPYHGPRMPALGPYFGEMLTPVPTPTPGPPPDVPQGPTLFDWLKTHTSVVSGVAIADGEKAEVLSVSVDVDFEVAPRLRGFAGLALFSRQRVQGESEPQVGIPLSLNELELYSAGRGVLGGYFELAPRVAGECRGGLSFEMTGILGKKGDPVDGSKFLLACGLRLSGEVGHLSLLGGHSGPTDDSQTLWGFIPSLVVAGEFRLSDSTSFILDVSAGRNRVTKEAITSSLFAVRTKF